MEWSGHSGSLRTYLAPALNQGSVPFLVCPLPSPILPVSALSDPAEESLLKLPMLPELEPRPRSVRAAGKVFDGARSGFSNLRSKGVSRRYALV